MYNIYKLNKLISYYFYTYIFDGNSAAGCGPGTDYPYIHIFQSMLERTDAITNKVPEPITFVLAYPTVPTYDEYHICQLQ
jgi:hypothetical protein